jgi:hypothetical protein
MRPVESDNKQTRKQMKPDKMVALIEGALRRNIKLLIPGMPGIGKTALIDQVRRKLDWNMVTIIGSMSDPTDTKGMPFVSNGVADFAPFGDLRTLLEATKPTVCFLDDLGQTPLSVQTSFMHMVHAREINGRKIPDTVRFIAATNGTKDAAGVSGIIEPLKSRFDAIVTLEPDLESWTKWAASSGRITREVISFLRFAPQHFCQFKPTKELIQSPSPRTWESASKWILIGVRDSEVLTGSVGHEAASMLVPFLSLQVEINVDLVLADPKGYPIPAKLDVLHSIATAIAWSMKPENTNDFMTYCNRMPAEFQAYVVCDACRRNPVLTAQKSISAWFASNGEIFL